MSPTVTSPARQAVLHRIAGAVLALPAAGTLRVAIDGIDGAGKTTLGDELRDALAPSGRPILRATVDGFHHPRAVRYRLGKGSPEGFYRDSYDYATLQAVLLDPLGPGGDGRFRRAVFDVDADLPVEAPVERAPPRAILLFDGMFLHRPELRDAWDLSILLRVPWPRNHHLRKLLERGPVDPGEGRFHRYREGQEIYFRECRPETFADLVVDNEDLAAPFLVEEEPPPSGPGAAGGSADRLPRC